MSRSKARKESPARLEARSTLHFLRDNQESQPDTDNPIDWDDLEDGMQLLGDLLRNVDDDEAVAVLELLQEEHGLDANYCGTIDNQPSTGDIEEWDPVAFAALFEKTQCALWLIDHCDGDAEAEATWGKPAVFMLNAQHVGPFLDRGLSPTVRGETGETLFHHLASGLGFDPSLAQRLLDEGLNLQEKDHRGVPPLHYAARENNPSFVRWALDHGADPLALCNKKTAADLAIEKGHTELGALLNAKILAIKEKAVLDEQDQADKKQRAQIGRFVLQMAQQGRLSIDGQPVDTTALCALSTELEAAKKKKRKKAL